MMTKNEGTPRGTCERFLDQAFRHLSIPDETQQLLLSPYREVRFELPLKKDDGSLALFYGYRVQHNNSRGPFKGGLRYHADVDMDHFVALASLMTWKTALIGLPLGGAKGGINCSPGELTDHEQEQLTKRYVERLGQLIGPDHDIPAPDMGTGPQHMAWFLDAYVHENGHLPGVVTGKPLELGGSAGRVEATGRGVAIITSLAAEDLGIDLAEASVAIQGFGNVGSYAARFLAEKGARIVAVSGVSGALYNEEGLDIEDLVTQQAKAGKKKLVDLDIDASRIDNDALLALDVDILIPAAIGHVINESNVDAIQAGMIVEAANMPVTCQADARLHERDITVIPDILANAGGVTVSYLEWVQNKQRYSWKKQRVHEELDRFLSQAWSLVAEKVASEQVGYREAAYLIAVERVATATALRGF